MASILVVDDDPDGSGVIETYLSKVGHTVRCVPNGRAALKALGEAVPDLILLDLMMPEMNGVEFLRVIRGYLRWGSVPVVVVTAHADGPHLATVRELGVNHVFIKGGFELAKLAICVNELVRNPA